MNFQAARLQTFYFMKDFTTEEKIFITMKGFYKWVDRLICYKCWTTYKIDLNSMDEVGSHQCRTPQINSTPNVDIPSPCIVPPINVHHDLNYEEFRYATFTNWCMVSTTKPIPLELAASGFYFAIDPQTVKCFYCETILHEQVITNGTIADHKNNKNCEQKKLAFQVRLNNLLRDLGLQGSSTRVLLKRPGQAGYSRLPPSVQQELEKFLSGGKKFLFYKKALDLGFDRYLINAVVKQRLQLQLTFENVEELIELCYAVAVSFFETNISRSV